VRVGNVRTPVASADGDDGELGDDDGAADGGGDLLGALDTETDVAGSVSEASERAKWGRANRGRAAIGERERRAA
jgi:hypothetical protein